jgi:hypothetical protein
MEGPLEAPSPSEPGIAPHCPPPEVTLPTPAARDDDHGIDAANSELRYEAEGQVPAASEAGSGGSKEVPDGFILNDKAPSGAAAAAPVKAVALPAPKVGPKARRHGLERPLSPFLIVLLTVIAIDIILVAAVCVPIMESITAKYAVSISYGAILVALVYSGARTAYCDPTDPDVGQTLTPEVKEIGIGRPFCYVCNIFRKEGTHHCRACDRCVHKWDHHCIWLGNCVGADNYRSFAWAVVLAAIKLAFVSLLSMVLIVATVIDGDEAYAPKGLVLTVLVFLVILNVPLCYMDLNLLVFHVGLTWKGLTTIDYIRQCNSYERAVLAGSAASEIHEQMKFKPFPMCVDWVIFRHRLPLPSKAKAAKAKVAPI